MKMNRKFISAAVLSASVVVGAFAYNSGIAQVLGFKEDSSEKVAAEVTLPSNIEKADTVEKAAEVKEAPPEVKKEETKTEVKQVTKKASTKNKTASKTAKVTVSRGTTVKKTTKTASKKTSTKTTTKTAAKTTLSKAGAYTISEAEKDLFYRLVSAEASSESFEGKLAVATVIMNRLKSPDYPNTIKGVIYDTKWGVQFTPVADGRINQPATAEAKRAVDKVLGGYRSFGSKVMFFMNPETSINPYVENNRTYFTTIGAHKFYY